MIKEGKVGPSSTTVGSPVGWVPKPNGQGIRLCVEDGHSNDYTKKDKMPLPIMEELQARLHGAHVSIEINLKSGCL